MSWFAPKHPEAAWRVGITASDEIVCFPPNQAAQRLSMDNLGSVYVETNTSGPWGADVWWVLNDRDGAACVTVPQLATGELDVLDRLQQLAGFRVRGMSTIERARFLCWSSVP